MDVDLVVVDGPNLYGHVATFTLRQFSKDDYPLAKRYLTEWFDIDRFVAATLQLNNPPKLGTVIFHSRRAIGRHDAIRLSGGNPELDSFWARQASNPDASSVVVDIPGDQQDVATFYCDTCQKECQAKSGTEKGVDSSMITYLFETAERWNSVCLFTQDVDFVPPVLALRRRGRQVFAASERGPNTSALVRSCQSFFDLDYDFLIRDIAMFRLFAAGRLLDVLRNLELEKFYRPPIKFHPAGNIECFRDLCRLHLPLAWPLEHEQTAMCSIAEQILNDAGLSPIAASEPFDNAATTEWLLRFDIDWVVWNGCDRRLDIVRKAMEEAAKHFPPQQL